ncbi:MAG: hypothetical protein WAX69_18010 [Victivallales bacterium]
MVCLAGGETLLDQMIARAQRHVDPSKEWSRWSHAFIIGERRCDGQLWVIESDLDIHRKHIRFGAQENRISKFHEDGFYTRLALLDFGLPPETVTKVLAGGLDMIAGRARYSLRELAGTLIALRHQDMRKKENPLGQPQSFYCSALVRCLFINSGVDLTPGLDIKNTTPEDIWRSLIVREAWVLEAHMPKRNDMAGTVEGVRRKIRLAKLKCIRNKYHG